MYNEFKKNFNLVFFSPQVFDISAFIILLIQDFFAYSIFFIMQIFTSCTSS